MTFEEQWDDFNKAIKIRNAEIEQRNADFLRRNAELQVRIGDVEMMMLLKLKEVLSTIEFVDVGENSINADDQNNDDLAATGSSIKNPGTCKSLYAIKKRIFNIFLTFNRLLKKFSYLQ